MKERVFELRIEEWKRGDWMLRGRRGTPGMGIIGVDEGGKTYCSCVEDHRKANLAQKNWVG